MANKKAQTLMFGLCGTSSPETSGEPGTLESFVVNNSIE